MVVHVNFYLALGELCTSVTSSRTFIPTIVFLSCPFVSPHLFQVSLFHFYGKPHLRQASSLGRRQSSGGCGALLVGYLPPCKVSTYVRDI